MGEDMLLDAVKTLRDGLFKISEELNVIVTQLNAVIERNSPAKQKATELLMDRSGRKYLADITVLDDVVTVDPVEALRIKAEDPAIRNFLLPSILDRLKEKRGVEYHIETCGELVRRIAMEKLPEGEWEKVKGAVRWAFEKASERIG
ncbi:MAG: hypothetical protein QXG97_00570 [Nitrososphaerota archaeon]